MRSFVLALLLSPAALAQTAPGDVAADTTATSFASSVFAFDAIADSVAAVRAERAARERERRAAEAARPAPPSQPTVEVFGTSGASALLPVGWEGPVTIAEVDLPGYALYSARNTALESPLHGAVLRVERVTGLNALYRERFAKGQTTYGYHGASPIGPAPVPEGLGLELSGPGTGGAVSFVQRGATLWAVSVEAPALTWAERRSEVLAVLAGVRLP